MNRQITNERKTRPYATTIKAFLFLFMDYYNRSASLLQVLSDLVVENLLSE